MNIQEILVKHGAKRDTYYQSNQNPHAETKEWINSVLDSYRGTGYPDVSLFDTSEYRYIKSKWRDKIKEDNIGFSLAQPCPSVFYVIIDDFLIEVSKICPNFLINSISIKNGGIRIRLENINEEIKEAIEVLEQELFDFRLLK